MTKNIQIATMHIGGNHPVVIQSMTTTYTNDIDRTLHKIEDLKRAGCQLVRVAVRHQEDAKAIKALKEKTDMPLIADIHFASKLAITAIESGADKVRINPGNIGGELEIKKVADCIKAHKIAVRVGSNSGSIEKNFLEQYGRSADALVESALYNVHILEKYGVNSIVISVKSSSVPLTVEAYRKLATRTDYPLHLGVTEAGTYDSGIIKSSIGIGALLLDGIGNTIRVSLADDPVQEVLAAKRILRACGLEENFVEVVACPTCGRCEWNCMPLAQKLEKKLMHVRQKCKVAVMGCIVNGIGEGEDSDIGIAGGKDKCIIFKGGKIERQVTLDQAEEVFFNYIDDFLKSNQNDRSK